MESCSQAKEKDLLDNKKEEQVLVKTKEKRMINRAICFRCKKKFRARKNQHPKYSICPSCKTYKDNFGLGFSWIDYRLSVSERRFIQSG